MPPVWFRAPYGAHCKRLEDMLAERALDHVYWDIDPQEWRHGSVKRTVDRVTGGLRRATGRNVVLLHDTKVVTVYALPRILGWLAAENDKRAAKQRRPIRIVDAPALAAEQAAPVVAWLREAAEATLEATIAMMTCTP
jgi:hypothetical protein